MRIALALSMYMAMTMKRNLMHLMYRSLRNYGNHLWKNLNVARIALHMWRWPFGMIHQKKLDARL